MKRSHTMTPNQSHVAGLELAKKAMEQQRERYGGVHKASLACLDGLIEIAKSAPAEVAQGEAVLFSQFLTAVMDAAGLVRHGRQSKELSEYLGKECIRLRLMNSLSAPAEPDAELVELLRDKFPLIDPCKPVPLDEKAHCCEYTIYVERERLHRMIDAKLASLVPKETS